MKLKYLDDKNHILFYDYLIYALIYLIYKQDGENYMEWLPPTKRISHHTWTVFDLGHYAEKYDLDDSYKECMSVTYSLPKLRQMKTVSDSMISEITAICDKHGALIVEDAAESFGATYKGKQTGTFGDYNAISFNGNKIITGSSGGMFLTDSQEDAEKVRKWSTQSREAAPWYQHEEIMN